MEISFQIIFIQSTLNESHFCLYYSQKLKITVIRTTAGTLFAYINFDTGFRTLRHTLLEIDDYIHDIDDVVDKNFYHEK